MRKDIDKCSTDAVATIARSAIADPIIVASTEVRVGTTAVEVGFQPGGTDARILAEIVQERTPTQIPKTFGKRKKPR